MNKTGHETEFKMEIPLDATWNEEYDYPKLMLASNLSNIQQLEQLYCKILKVHKHCLKKYDQYPQYVCFLSATPFCWGWLLTTPLLYSQSNRFQFLLAN